MDSVDTDNWCSNSSHAWSALWMSIVRVVRLEKFSIFSFIYRSRMLIMSIPSSFVFSSKTERRHWSSDLILSILDRLIQSWLIH